MKVIKYGAIALIGMIILIVILLVRCNNSDTLDKYNLIFIEDTITLNVGESTNIYDLIYTDIDHTLLSFVTHSTMIAEVNDDEVVAKSCGETLLVVKANINNYEYVDSINIVVEASNVVVEQVYNKYYNTHVTKKITLESLFNKLNIDCKELISVTIEDDILEYNTNEEYFIANSFGSTIVSIRTKYSSTCYKTYNISINIDKVKISLNAKVVNDNGDTFVNMYNDRKYYIKITGFSGLKLDDLVFSDNVQVVSSEILDSNALIEFKLINGKDIEISYSDNKYFGDCVIENTFVLRDETKFKCVLYNNNNEILCKDGVYNFLVGVDGVTSPYINKADIVVLYDNVLIDEPTLSIFGSSDIRLEDSTVYIDGEGNATITISCLERKFDITIQTSRAYSDTISVQYPKTIYYSETNNVELSIFPDYEYNYLPEDIIILSNVKVDGTTLLMYKYIPEILAEVSYKDQVIPIKINVVKYLVDEIVIKYNGSEIINNTINLKDGVHIIEIITLCNGNAVPILDTDIIMREEYTSNISISSTGNYLYVLVGTNAEAEICFYNANSELLYTISIISV